MIKHGIVSLALGALLLSSVVSGQPHSQAISRRPNIIFILVDDLRWDELSITGHPFIKTTSC